MGRVAPGVVLALLALLGGGAARSHATDGTDLHVSFAERLARTAPRDPGVTSDAWIAGIRRVAATGFDALPAFWVAARLESLRRFPCRECHTKPLATLRAPRRKDARGHWEITLVHAPASAMSCGSCHGGDDMQSLRMLGGSAVELDHAYRVCGQCHAGQVKDWAGGAHGKRLGGWAPPRLVVSCPACHDPHQPRLATRWPSRASRVAPARD